MCPSRRPVSARTRPAFPTWSRKPAYSEMKRDTSWTSQAVLARRCRLSPGLAMSRRTRRTSPSWKPVSTAGPNEAAPDLAEFYRGINATNEHGSDVHLSAFGHSYGSLTTAQALNELGATGVVDDAAFYGSPGLGYTNETWTDRSIGIPIERPYVIDDESDLFLADGHAFVMSAPEDPISGDPNVLGIPMPSAGDLGQFGPNPLTLPLEHCPRRRR